MASYTILSGTNKVTVTVEVIPNTTAKFPDIVTKEEVGKTLAQDFYTVLDTDVCGFIMNELCKELSAGQNLNQVVLELKRHLLRSQIWTADEVKAAFTNAANTP